MYSVLLRPQGYTIRCVFDDVAVRRAPRGDGGFELAICGVMQHSDQAAQFVVFSTMFRRQSAGRRVRRIPKQPHGFIFRELIPK